MATYQECPVVLSGATTDPRVGMYYITKTTTWTPSTIGEIFLRKPGKGVDKLKCRLFFQDAQDQLYNFADFEGDSLPPFAQLTPLFDPPVSTPVQCVTHPGSRPILQELKLFGTYDVLQFGTRFYEHVPNRMDRAWRLYRILDETQEPEDLLVFRDMPVDVEGFQKWFRQFFTYDLEGVRFSLCILLPLTSTQVALWCLRNMDRDRRMAILKEATI